MMVLFRDGQGFEKFLRFILTTCRLYCKINLTHGKLLFVIIHRPQHPLHRFYIPFGVQD